MTTGENYGIGLISFAPNFSQFAMSKLISKDFPNIGGNYKNYVRLGGKAVLASKNKDVDDLNIKIQSEIHSIKSIDSILPIDHEIIYALWNMRV